MKNKIICNPITTATLSFCYTSVLTHVNDSVHPWLAYVIKYCTTLSPLLLTYPLGHYKALENSLQFAFSCDHCIDLNTLLLKLKDIKKHKLKI